MTHKDLSVFSALENDIHFLVLILEQIWKAAHHPNSKHEGQAEALQMRYRKGLIKVKDALLQIERHEDVLDYLGKVKDEILLGVTQEAQVTIYKKLDIDFSVMVKKLNTEKQTVQKSENPAEEPFAETPRSGENMPLKPAGNSQSTQTTSGNVQQKTIAPARDKHYTPDELLALVKSTEGIRVEAFRRKQAKLVLANLIKVIREKNPQKISERIDAEFSKNKSRPRRPH